MAIEFSNIPANLAVPLTYFEVHAAPSSGVVERTFALCQKTGSGSATLNVIYTVRSAADAVTYFGEGSMGHLMALGFFANNPTGILDMAAVDDVGAGTAGVKQIQVNGDATAAGTIYLEVAGHAISVAVASGDGDDTIATAINAALTAEFGLPFTSGVINDADDDKVACTARHKGVAAADWDVIANPKGLAGGQEYPAGVTLTLSTTTAGASDPTDIAAIITAMGDTPYRYVICPYWTGDALTDMLTEMESRWGYARQIRGVVLSAVRGSASTVASATSSLNDANCSILGVRGSTTPIYQWAGAYAGVASRDLLSNPSRSLSTAEVKGVSPIPTASLYTMAERQTIYTGGAAATTRKPGQRYDRIDVPRTTYLLDDGGAPSTVFSRLERRITTARTPEYIGSKLFATFGRANVVPDGTPVSPTLTVASPSTVKSVVLAALSDLVTLGWYHSLDLTGENILCEINEDNPARIDVAATVYLASQLEILAAKLTVSQ